MINDSLIVFIFILCQLIWSQKPNMCITSFKRPMFFLVNYSNLIPQGWMFFLFFSTFSRHTAFRYSSSLTFSERHVSIVTALDGVYTILGHIVYCWGLDTAEIFSKCRAAGEYCPIVIWTVYFSIFFGLAFDIGQTDCGNLLSFLLRCGTRPYERGTQWDSNSLV